MRQAQKRNLPGREDLTAAQDKQIYDATLFRRQSQWYSPEQNLRTGKPERSAVHITEILPKPLLQSTVYGGNGQNILRPAKTAAGFPKS